MSLEGDAFSVCMELGIEEVNVEVVDLGSPEEEVRYLVLNNKQRDKTNEQKAKEAKVLKEIESKLADARRLGNLKQNKATEVADLPHRKEGKARDIVEILCKLRKAIGNTRILYYSVKNIENTCALNPIITVGNGMICRTKHRTKLCKLTEKWM